MRNGLLATSVNCDFQALRGPKQNFLDRVRTGVGVDPDAHVRIIADWPAADGSRTARRG